MLTKIKKPKVFIVLGMSALLTLAVGYYFLSSVQAFTSNNGIFMFGDSGTTRGRTNARNYTYGSPGTVSAERVATQRTNFNIHYLQTKSAPTRQEKLVGQLKTDGVLHIENCAGACDNATSFVNQWNATITATDITARAFDISYEQLSGRGMVVYGSSANTGKLYYCIWDGSSWGPVTNCAPTNGTNDITLADGTTTMTGSPRWVRMASYGEQFGDKRSNEILLGVQDSNNDIYVTRWTGSAWSTTDDQVVTTTGGDNVLQAAFDVDWENTSGTAMTMYSNGTGLQYRTSTGSGWSAANAIQTLAAAAEWVNIASDSKSNRLSAAVQFNSSAIRAYVWKGDGSTVGWTAAGTDLTAETNAGINMNTDTAWEKSSSGTPQAMFVSATSGALVTSYRTWTQAGGFTAWATTTGNSGDDVDIHMLFPSPNSDEIMNLRADHDCDINWQPWSGSAWKTMTTTDLTTTLTQAAGTATCTSNTNHTQQPFSFAWVPYAAWSKNWRFYDDESTSGNPGISLAAEGITATIKPNNSFRLRLAIAELGGNSDADTRKKLQYSTGAGCPDSNSCTWTDVGAQGSGTIWRYANGGNTDDALVPSVSLTGATAVGNNVENGTAAAPLSDHSALTTREYDFALQNNGATIGVTYYFRAYDLGASISGGSTVNLNPIFRQQIKNTAGTEQTSCRAGLSAAVCSYPTVLSYTSAPYPPTFYRPVSGNTNVSTAPVIQLKSRDDENDNIQYMIEWCPSNSWPCPSGGGSFDQTVTQTGWNGQDADSNTTYVGKVEEVNSTMAAYTVSPGVFSPNTTYYLRARATDPNGSATIGLYSSTLSFTTATLEIRIIGGADVSGGTAFGN